MRIIMLAIILAAFVLSSFLPIHPASADTLPLQETDSVAGKAIQNTLSGLYKNLEEHSFVPQKAQKAEEAARALGFESLQQLSTAKVGPGFPIFYVRLDKLRGYQTGTDPWPLLIKTNQSIYPLMVLQDNGLQVRSSATVSTLQDEKSKSMTSRVTELGDPELIRLLTETKKNLQKDVLCVPPFICFVVSIPALNLHLFGFRNERTLEFNIVSLDHLPGQLKKGGIRTAAEVFKELQIVANDQKYDMRPHTPDKKKQLNP